MNTWITSDLHLFHKNIITYCNRPHSDEYEMNDVIINAWNSTVKPDDRVIVVGDLTAGLYDRQDALLEVIGRLAGVKTLVMGNHDHLRPRWYKEAGFANVVKHSYEDGVLFVHKPAGELHPKSIALKERYKPKIIIHGHVHALGPEFDGHFNVAWDRHNRLLSLEEIISKCN